MFLMDSAMYCNMFSSVSNQNLETGEISICDSGRHIIGLMEKCEKLHNPSVG